MHELSLVQALSALVDAECAERGARAKAVRIAVGELASVEPSLLVLAWEDAAPQHGTLTVDFCAARQTCATCGDVADRQPGSWLRLCPTCGSPLRVSGGDELELVEIDFEEDPVRC
ncbi:MAG: hydrogenase maturation nickel metallochaperone HypA [Planctomycetes bacterium]|nr:hydrogenase maturation nickel metallochaperone HypA [Planctomycetota bacterium]